MHCGQTVQFIRIDKTRRGTFLHIPDKIKTHTNYLLRGPHEPEKNIAYCRMEDYFCVYHIV